MAESTQKPAKKVVKATPIPAKGKPPEEKVGKPVEAILAFVVVLAGAVILLLQPVVFRDLDIVSILFILFGLILLVLSFYVFRVEFWSWSSVFIVLVLMLLLAIPSLSWVALGYSIFLAIVLFIVRRTYGVGVWKIQQAEEERARKAREAIRSTNKEGYHCPRCKGTNLYICDDGSTYCKDCHVGFVDIKHPTVTPPSSV